MASPSPAFVAAIARHREGALDEAAALYRQVLDEGAPNEKRAAHANLGQMELGAGRFLQAAEYFYAALAMDPEQTTLWRDLGAALLQAGDPAGAAEAFHQFLSRQPLDAEAHYNLALALSALGDNNAARAALTKAVTLKPGFAQAHNNLGNLDIADDPGRALGHFDAALANNSDLAAGWFNRGLALEALGRVSESAEAFARAATLDPASQAVHAQTRLDRAASFAEAGHYALAIAGHETLRRTSPRLCENLAGLLHAKQQICDWDGVTDLCEELLAEVEAGGTAPPFILAAIGAPGAMQTRNATRWAARVAPRRGARPPLSRHDGRIRLGYLSGDFHDHATAHLMAGLFENHDRAAFEITAYSYGPDDHSAMRRRLEAAFEQFTDIANLSHSAAAERIRADGIDILVDLKGYTAGARPQIPALRPAPVQVNWLGFPGSMGVDFIDYVIADAVLAPFSMQPDCVERIVHLPDCFQPNATQRSIGPATSRAAHGLPEIGFVFCCFNNAYKLTPEFFQVWMRLLRAVPGSVLWLLDANANAKENLAAEAQAQGIDPARLVFAPRVPMPAHLVRHALADLFLDTLPVNALTTASDALYAGLPLLTMLGDTVAGRGCASLLTAMGMTDMIMPSLTAYESQALELAITPVKLHALRRRLQQARGTAPLFNTARFTRHLEDAYRDMLIP